MKYFVERFVTIFTIVNKESKFFGHSFAHVTKFGIPVFYSAHTVNELKENNPGDAVSYIPGVGLEEAQPGMTGILFGGSDTIITIDADGNGIEVPFVYAAKVPEQEAELARVLIERIISNLDSDDIKTRLEACETLLAIEQKDANASQPG